MTTRRPALFRYAGFLASAVFAFSSCAPATVRIDPTNDPTQEVAGLSYRDFEYAASKAVQSMLASGAVHHPSGKRYVLMISRVTNDTMQFIDVSQLVKKIRSELLASGNVVVTTAVGDGESEDPAIWNVRTGVAGNRDFDQSRVPRDGTLVPPDLSLTGVILQHNLTIERPGMLTSGKQQIEYSFQLTLTNLNTGLAVWEKEMPIIKQTRNDTASW